jgi:hypothetical protein
MVNVFWMAKKRIKVLWHDSNGGLAPSAVRHPIKFFDSLKIGRKQRKGGKKGHNEWATTIRSRVVNGPELNILLLGLPFIIDVGISAAVKTAKDSKAAKKPPPPPMRERDREIDAGPKLMKIKVTPPPPLPHSPYSDQYEKVRQKLIGAGRSAEGATAVVMSSGGSDLNDELSVEDLAIMIEVMVAMDPDSMKEFQKVLQG